MKGQIKLNTNLVGRISTGGGSNNSDHITVPHKSEQLINVTSSITNKAKYQDLQETNGSTVEYIPGVKSVDNPSSLTHQVINGENLYSLQNGTYDTMTISDGLVTINRKCGCVVIDGSFPDVYAWRHSGASNVPDGFFCVSWLSSVVNDKILASTTNIYCNRLEPVSSVASSVSASVVISNQSGIYIVLPTGVCEETNAALHEWLNTHPIEIIYPLAIPFVEKYSIDCDETLVNMSTINKTSVPAIDNYHPPENENYITLTFNASGGTQPYTYKYGQQDPEANHISWHFDEYIGGTSECTYSVGTWLIASRVTDSNDNYRDRIFTITAT